MKRVLFILLVVATFAAGAGVMRLKYAVAQKAERLERLAAQIAEDRRDIRILEAELAHLTTPERLEDRAGQHLALMPPRPDQIILSPTHIPLRLRELTKNQAVKRQAVKRQAVKKQAGAKPPAESSDQSGGIR